MFLFINLAIFLRWRFVIHGGIDGFSRLVYFMKVANNNRSNTVLSGFLQGVESFGLPSRVRLVRIEYL